MSTTTKHTRRASVLTAVLAAFVFGSCDGDGVSGPPQSTALALTITAAAGVSVDQGRVLIEGTTNRTITLQPGDTREIELPAGSYNIALEGLTAGVVTSYFQRNNVSVTEGRLTSVTATLSTFAGVTPTVPSTGVLGQPVTVSWAPVSGADTYDVEASSSDLFSPLLESQTVGGTSAQFTFTQAGVVYFRVRPRTRFNGAGPFSTASLGVTVADPAIATVTVEPVSVTVPLNGTADFVATARSASGTIIPSAQFTWSSDDESVATVNGIGRATGVGGGITNIVATADGISGSGQITVSAGAPPQVVAYDVAFRPNNQACGIFQDFRTDERLSYTDADGNMNAFGTFVEPTSGPPTGIDSQFREEGASAWREFGYEKTWVDEAGSSGSSGGLDALGTSCWDFTGEPTYMDFRVRIRDSNGNWSEWFEVRRNLPAEVVIVPESQFNMVLGETRVLTATALDANGVQVPGDPINWSSYVGSPHAVVSPTGSYTVSPTSAGGLDYVAARGAYVYGIVAVQAGFSNGSWFSPGWLLGNISLTQSSSSLYMMRVYEGRVYTLTIDDDPGVTSTGDLDLFIRFGQTATLADHDDSSENAGHAEEIVWTAPADGMLSIMLYAFNGTSPVAGARFGVSGGVVAPRSFESLATPGAARASVGFAPDDHEGQGGMLLPPAMGEWGPTPPLVEVRPTGPNASSGGR